MEWDSDLGCDHEKICLAGLMFVFDVQVEWDPPNLCCLCGFGATLDVGGLIGTARRAPATAELLLSK
jgi:hypothetical protein